MRDAWGRVRAFLAGGFSKELLVFLFFLIVAAVFWVLQTLDETLRKEVSVRMELVGVPEDVIITSPLPDEIRAVVSDKGTSLLHYIRYGVDPLRINFPDYDNGSAGGCVTLLSADIHRMLQGSLLGTSKITSISPDTLEFFYNRGQCRTVPVIVAGVIDASPECYLLDVSVSPSEVQVYAPSAVLDTLTAVYTVPLSLDGIAENTVEDVGLRAMRGAKYSQESVRVDVRVDVYVEDTLEVPIRTSNFPAGKTLRTFPTEVRVDYTVGYAHSKKITEEDFVIMFTYEQILACQREGRTKIPLTLRTVPEEVVSVRIEPTEVDYLIESGDAEE